MDNKKEPIRRQVSRIIGVLIPKDKWEETFDQVNKEGRLDNKAVLQMLVVILKKLEEYESLE